MDSIESDNDNQSGLTGWIKLHRQIVDSEVFQDADLLRLWIWLLAKARHKPGFESLDSGKIIHLKIGDVMSGRNTGAALFKWKPSTYRDRLYKLRDKGMVTLVGDGNCTVVSITNFQAFQRGHGHQDDNHQVQSTIKVSEAGRQPSLVSKPNEIVGETYVANSVDDNPTTTRRQPDDNPPPQKKNVKNVKKNITASLLPLEKPSDVSEKVWSDWLTVRKSKRAGALTDTGLSAIRSESVLAGKTLEEALTICCKRSWIGFESSWLKDNRQDSKPVSNSSSVLRPFKPRERT